MSIFEAVLSGILQGACEFLPISSSGHLVLLHRYLGYEQPFIIFNIYLHIGTLLAILVYFRKDIYLALTKETQILLLIIIACIPTGVIAFLFESFFKQAFTNVKLVGFMLIVTAVFLFAGDLAARFRQHHAETKAKLGFGKALIIGMMQGISVLPGLSRSGLTISTGLICQVRKKEAIKYSFLLAIPAILGALLFQIKGLKAEPIYVPQIIAGILSAFFIGLISIYYVIRAITKDRLSLFGIYCLLIGCAVLLKVYL